VVSNAAEVGRASRTDRRDADRPRPRRDDGQESAGPAAHPGEFAASPALVADKQHLEALIGFPGRRPAGAIVGPTPSPSAAPATAKATATQ
jgi:hypothetical protein